MKSLQHPLLKVTILSIALCGPLTLSYAKDSVGAVINDGLIVTTIKLKQTADPLLNPFKITVTSHHGIVKLQGTVKTHVQFERAVAEANSIENVRDVDTRDLKVRASDKPLTDSIITAKIKGKLLQSKLYNNVELDALDIKVETKNQQVFLVGEVNSVDERKTVIRIAESIKDVKSVNASALTLRRS